MHTTIGKSKEPVALSGPTIVPVKIFVFLGGYFPTIYYKEIFSRTEAVDLIVIGEGEIPSLKIIECLEKNKDPRKENVPNSVWVNNGKTYNTELGLRFDLKKKVPLNFNMLKYSKSYDVLPYSFSRGCPYNCNFCMEEYIRPIRKEAPESVVEEDLLNLSRIATHFFIFSASASALT